jgi:hypothetical protein
MSSDRELLELAAKAIGLQKPRFHEATGKDYDCGTCILYDTYQDGWRTFEWNPLERDADALALAVRLGLTVYTRFEGKYNNAEETRRSIVGMAAARGRQL